MSPFFGLALVVTIITLVWLVRKLRERFKDKRTVRREKWWKVTKKFEEDVF